MPCRAGTLFLSLAYNGAARDAEQLALDITVGDARQHFATSRVSGAAGDSVEVTFAHYPAGERLVIDASATRSAVIVGVGHTATSLASGCAAVQLTLLAGDDRDQLPPATDDLTTLADLAATTDGAVPIDLAASPNDLSSRDLASSNDLWSPNDLASLGDLALRVDLAAIVDLAVVPIDLAVPPDLRTPLDLATSSIGFSGVSNTVETASSASPPFDDACPAGQALSGLHGYIFINSDGSQGWLQQIGGDCSS